MDRLPFELCTQILSHTANLPHNSPDGINTLLSLASSTPMFWAAYQSQKAQLERTTIVNSLESFYRVSLFLADIYRLPRPHQKIRRPYKKVAKFKLWTEQGEPMVGLRREAFRLHKQVCLLAEKFGEFIKMHPPIVFKIPSDQNKETYTIPEDELARERRLMLVGIVYTAFILASDYVSLSSKKTGYQHTVIMPVRIFYAAMKYRNSVRSRASLRDLWLGYYAKFLEAFRYFVGERLEEVGDEVYQESRDASSPHFKSPQLELHLSKDPAESSPEFNSLKPPYQTITSIVLRALSVSEAASLFRSSSPSSSSPEEDEGKQLVYQMLRDFMYGARTPFMKPSKEKNGDGELWRGKAAGFREALAKEIAGDMVTLFGGKEAEVEVADGGDGDGQQDDGADAVDDGDGVDVDVDAAADGDGSLNEPSSTSQASVSDGDNSNTSEMGSSESASTSSDAGGDEDANGGGGGGGEGDENIEIRLDSGGGNDGIGKYLNSGDEFGGGEGEGEYEGGGERSNSGEVPGIGSADIALLSAAVAVMTVQDDKGLGVVAAGSCSATATATASSSSSSRALHINLTASSSSPPPSSSSSSQPHAHTENEKEVAADSTTHKLAKFHTCTSTLLISDHTSDVDVDVEGDVYDSALPGSGRGAVGTEERVF